jgi:DUF4097 and DUF4098 domain-containing protein YvlB
MYSALLIGALTAVASPQEPEKKVESWDIGPQVAMVQIEIPAIEIPEFDIYIPAFSFDVPSADYWDGFEAYWDGFKVYWDGFDVEIPAIEISVPEVDSHFETWWHESDGWSQDVEIDTSFAVNPDAVLIVRNHAGETIIRTWSRNEVRIQASYSSEDRINVQKSESAVRIRSETRHGHPEEVDYEITVPSSMAVDLWGLETDISVAGARGGVKVETLGGEVEVIDAGGEMSLRSVEGDITVMRSQGSLEANGADGDITVQDFEGDILVESIDGEIQLEGINSSRVEAKSVDGGVFYDGSITDNGRYKLSSHDGDVIVSIPGDANANVSVATFDGEFEAEFPVRLESAEGQRKLNFVLGNGGARLELHSFDGDIRLERR